jgi:hypothetical protein
MPEFSEKQMQVRAAERLVVSSEPRKGQHGNTKDSAITYEWKMTSHTRAMSLRPT